MGVSRVMDCITFTEEYVFKISHLQNLKVGLMPDGFNKKYIQKDRKTIVEYST